MRRAVYAIVAAAIILTGATAPVGVVAREKKSPPNFVIIMFDDLSPRIGAFGDRVARTPHLDAFAKKAVRFPNTFVTAPVCAPSRAALFSGRHQQSINAQHMRTKGVTGLPGGGPIEYEAAPPPEVKWLPELLRRAGYFTVNVGKTDYQIGDPFTIWDVNAPAADWRKRPADKPFMAFINLPMTHESYLWPQDTQSANPLVQMIAARNRRDLVNQPVRTDPATVRVPAYLPDTPVVRADIARVYDNVAHAERQVGMIMQALEDDGVLDNTIVIVASDHGDGLPRMKRAIYDAGLRVPLMIRMPDRRSAGTERTELVSFIDLAPTILDLSGQPVPLWMHGRSIVSGAKPQPYIYAGADRFDGAVEWQRTVIDGRFQYVRNYRTDLAHFRPLMFRDVMPTMQELWRMNAAGTLPPAAAQYFSVPRQRDELYDLQVDRDTVLNLAGDPRYASHLRRLARALDSWAAKTGDTSQKPEAAMIAAQWPGMQQPVTAPPQLAVQGMRVSMSSRAPGASIGYRINGGSWQVYTRPLRVTPSDRIEAKAIRYGYRESAVASLRP